jgi:hypothetical protein
MSNVINWPTTRYGIFWQPPGTAWRESVGRGFEPRPPHLKSVLRRLMVDILSSGDA